MATMLKGKLEKWEIAIIKAMVLAKQPKTDQDILAYFTRPSRSINHRAIGEIRTGKRYKAIDAADAEELAAYLGTYPDIDQQTGLSARGDELLLKAREAMIAAVNTFNSLGLMFRSELFIVTAIIAWTYFMHAWFKKKGVDFRYIKNGQPELTKNGAEKYWELGKCLNHPKSPLPKGTVNNLEFLLELRHEIEHKSTNRIDDAVSAKLQACCLNFNDAIQAEFGKQYALERRLPIALQFVTFNPDLQGVLKKAASLPAHIETMMDTFQNNLKTEERDDPRFAFRVVFIPKLGKATNADLAVQFFKADSPEAKAFAETYILKEVDKPRFSASGVVKRIRKEGFPKFDMHRHTVLWKSLNAKKSPDFGAAGPHKNTWFWFEPWITRVRAHCQENSEKYK
jgi:hypothetical protein